MFVCGIEIGCKARSVDQKTWKIGTNQSEHWSEGCSVMGDGTHGQGSTGTLLIIYSSKCKRGILWITYSWKL